MISEMRISERADSCRSQELDASLMDAAKPMSSGGTVREYPHYGGTMPMQVSF